MDIFMGIVIGFLLGLCIYIFYKRKTKSRLEEISNMIDRLNKKDYQISIKQDEFSKLEDGIYKLFLENVESRENMKTLYSTQSKNLEDISHQIKTPITAILFQLENMNIENESLSGLRNQVERLNSLTDILLKLSSLDANIDKMKRENISLSEVVDYSLEILDGDIISKNVSIVKDKINDFIICDYYWICEAVINIIKNAIFVSENKSIFISSISNPIYTSLIIEDRGMGIPKENIRKIFERFYKTPDSNGFGIGLSMAKSIIEANNGEISVENTKMGGKFIIKFYKVT